MKEKIETQEGFELLQVGDVIKKDDEFLPEGGTTWLKTIRIGFTVGGFIPYRRKIKPRK